MELEHVFEEKDLGVNVDMELNFEEHISTKVNKANAIMGLIRRTFNYLDERLFKTLYTTFVLPHIEYAQSVWSPHHLKHIRKLENVQIRATAQIDGMRNMEYPERLMKLNLPTLVFRRERGDMIEVWKHFNTYDGSTLSPNFIRNTRNSKNHPHQLQLSWNRPSDGVRGAQANSFYFRIATKWNKLQASVVNAPNINKFKNARNENWMDHTQKYTIENNNDRFLEAFLVCEPVFHDYLL